MKLLLSISFLLLLTWQLFFSLSFIAYWKVNQATISKTLCENREKPQMQCNGKCYLNKQLKKTEEQEKNNLNAPVPVLKLKSVDFFVLQTNKIKFISIEFSIGNPNYSLSIVNYSSHTSPHFQPPELI